MRRRHTSYGPYIRGPRWRTLRRAWAQHPDTPKACVVCGARRYQLHHRTYQHLGDERLADLVPLCGAHHEALHFAYDLKATDLDLEAFTNAWVSVMRRAHPNPRRPPWPWP